MTEHKFTDERIIRCLNECSGKSAVAHIVDQGEDELVTLGRLLEIINRQKAEIADKDKAIKNALEIISIGEKQILEVGASWIKEFAERLKTELTTGSAVMRVSTLDVIDDLVKEMTEGKAHEMQSTDQP